MKESLGLQLKLLYNGYTVTLKRQYSGLLGQKWRYRGSRLALLWHCKGITEAFYIGKTVILQK